MLSQERKTTEQDYKLTETTIDYVPSKVNWDDIHENGMLLTDEQIKLALTLPPGKHKKGEGELKDFPFSVLVTTHEDPDSEAPIQRTFAVYERLAGGGFAKARLAQELQIDPTHSNPQKWVVLKLQTQQFASQEAFEQTTPAKVLTDPKREYNILTHLREALGQNVRKKIPKAQKTKAQQEDVVTQPGAQVGGVTTTKTDAQEEKKQQSEPYFQQHIIAMKLARGIELTKLHQVELPPIKYINIMLNVLRALQDLHKKDLLHLDIKPHNIIVDPRTCEVTIIDFATLAKGVRREDVLGVKMIPQGSPYYMPPEIRDILRKYKTFEEMVKKMRDKGEDPLFTFTEKTEVYSLGMALLEGLGLTKLVPLSKEEYEASFKESILNNLKHMLVLLDPMSDEYKHHKVLPDEGPRNEIYHLLAAMISAEEKDPNASKRPSLDTVIKRVEKIQEDYLQTSACILNARIVSLDELLQASKEDRAKIYAKLKLKECDEIIIVSETPRKSNDIPLLKIVSEIEAAGFQINPVLFGPDQGKVPFDSLVNKIKDKLAEDKGLVRKCEVVSLEKAPTAEEKAKNVDLQNFKNRVADFLEADAKRLVDKYKGKSALINTRIAAIRGCAGVIQAKKDYTEIHEALEALQTKMISKNLKGFLFKETKSSHTSKEIEKFKLEIKNKL